MPFVCGNFVFVHVADVLDGQLQFAFVVFGRLHASSSLAVSRRSKSFALQRQLFGRPVVAARPSYEADTRMAGSLRDLRDNLPV
jgi:hypothetical protein